jgi:hypothetical protein
MSCGRRHDIFVAMYVSLVNAKRVHDRLKTLAGPQFSFDVYVWGLGQM